MKNGLTLKLISAYLCTFVTITICVKVIFVVIFSRTCCAMRFFTPSAKGRNTFTVLVHIVAIAAIWFRQKFASWCVRNDFLTKSELWL